VRIGVALLCALIGATLGYLIGVFVGCDWLMPTSNLCGIYGAVLTGPIGFIAGGIFGWKRSTPR
jgi:hypothetical protein